MPKLAYKAALAHAFGRGSDRPLRTAYMRLVGLTAGALVLGVFFALTARELVLSPPPHPSLLFFGCALIVQIIVTLTLLSGAGVLSNDNDTFARLLKTLPLHMVHRSVLLLLPTLVLAGLALLLTATPLAILMHALAAPPLMVLAGMLVGTASGLGLARGLPFPISARLLCIAVTIWVEYKLSVLLNTQKDIVAIGVVIYALLLAALVGLCINILVHRGNYTPRPSHGNAIRTAWMPPVCWPLKQLLRTKSLVLSLGVGFLLSIGLAVLSLRQGLADPATLGLLGALLAGSSASDVRALARRHRPAEITALRGTLNFVGAQAITTYLGGLIIAAPLIWALLPTVPFTFATQIVLGVSIGLLSGALIVPEARDIMSQFLAIILILGLLVGLPQLPFANQLSASGHAIADMGITLICLAGALGIEIKRNNYRWRKTHHAQ